VIYGWTPRLPTVWGWITVADYLIAFLLAARAARSDWRNSGIWLVIALAMVILCINRVIDLQSLFKAFGRQMASQNGWYEERGLYQAILVGSIAAIFADGFLSSALTLRKSGGAVALALAGAILLVGFVITRSISLQLLDEMLKLRIADLSINLIIENAVILFVLSCAAYAIVEKRRLHWD